ncbi:hypothetical protein P7H20_21495 [Paenibacillus larvae]|nr:hypothetical protein [Paenibacillus larvae]MDT2276889.1 hypothetical protein [Paenibacillus larvae]
MNLIDDYDKLEKAARSLRRIIRRPGTSYSSRKHPMENPTRSPRQISMKRFWWKHKKFIGTDEIKYAELANFRDEEDIQKNP